MSNIYIIITRHLYEKKQVTAKYLQYVKERFPLVQFIPLAALLSLAASLSTQVYLNGKFVNVDATIMAFAALFLFLFRLRLFDEFKDYEHDVQYYPHRPIARGFILLKELRPLVFITILLETIIAVNMGIWVTLLYVLALTYSLLMFKEFFARDWLRKHFTTYIISHEILLVPLLFYVYALNGFSLWNLGDLFFWVLTLFLGSQLFLLEVTRKVRPKHKEIESRDTYTAQYGIAGASVLILFLAILSVSSLLYMKDLFSIGIYARDILYVFVFALLAYSILVFNKSPMEINAKKVFNSSIVFVVALVFLFVAEILVFA